MNTNRLYELMVLITTQYRKGPEVVERVVSGIRSVDVYAMDHESSAPADNPTVDVHFMTISVNKALAEKHRDEIVSILNDYPEPERLAGGPSYIEVGAVLGSQDLALQLFAVGSVLGLWEVMIPEKLGIKGMEADRLAGSGFVMITGYHP